MGKGCSRKRGDHLKRLILACSVMEREIRRFQDPLVECRFFDYGLHRTPENMAGALQEVIDQVADEEYGTVVLGYGLCCNGLVGICCRNQPLVIPRIHDCIALFLGSVTSYRYQTTEYPGTYYLTPGWIEKGETPISKFEAYTRSYDQQTAEWVLHEEMKHYHRIALIDTGAYHEWESYRRIARANARLLGISYEELKGSSTLFKDLVRGPWGDSFLVLTRGHSVDQGMFLDL